MFLAQKLGMTLTQLRAEMPAAEFVRWGVYYGRQAQRAQLDGARSGGG